MWLKSIFFQHKLSFLLVILLVGAVDQVLKFFSYFWKENPLSFGWLEFVWYENPGIAFSIDLPRDIAIVLAIITLGILFRVYWQTSLRAGLYRLGLTLIMAGGLSNLLDKIFLGFVRDMISLTLFPIFNLADVAIFLGIILIIIRWSHAEAT